MIHRCRGNSGTFAEVTINFSNYTTGDTNTTVTGATFIVTQATKDALAPSLPPDQGYYFVVVPEQAVLDFTNIVVEGTSTSVRAGCNAINGEAVSLGNMPAFIIRTSNSNQAIWGMADNAGPQPLHDIVDHFIQIQTDPENPGQPLIITDGSNQCNALDAVMPAPGDLPPTFGLGTDPAYVSITCAENPFWRSYVQTTISGNYTVKIPYVVGSPA